MSSPLLDTGLPKSPALRSTLRLSSGSSSEDADKRLRGFQHIIQDLSAENAGLKDKHKSAIEEVNLLKEELRLMEELSTTPNGASDGGDLKDAQATIRGLESTIKDLNREVSELESLVESKIYREDELETRLAELEREVEKWKLRVAAASMSSLPTTSAQQTTGSTQASLSSRAANHLNKAANGNKEPEAIAEASSDRCELCEGPHELDACPIFSGTMDDGKHASANSPSMGRGGSKTRKFCEDCEVSFWISMQKTRAELDRVRIILLLIVHWRVTYSEYGYSARCMNRVFRSRHSGGL
jgi:hypothetical protein